MGTVIIKPRKGSRSFSSNIIKQYFDSPEDEANNRPSREVPYEGERWEGTMEDILPIYSWSKGRFMIVDPEDITKSKLLENNSDTLNELVKRCRFRYEEGHPKQGEPIEKADIFDPEDPFFRHTDTYITLSAGRGSFEDSVALNEIMMLCALGTDEFEIGGSKENPYLNAKVRYIVVDQSIDRRVRRNRREKTKLAIEKLSQLSENDQIKVALALNLIQDPYMEDKGVIEELLWDYANNNTDIVRGMNTKQDEFLNIIEQGKTLLNASYLFTLGLKEGVIRRLDLMYQAFGQVLGKNREDAISYLTENPNAELYEKIENAVRHLVKSNEKANMVTKKKRKKPSIKLETEEEE